MTISDANKKNMLQFEPLIDMLLQSLVIEDDNHLKVQEDANVWTEPTAGVWQNFSLLGLCAAARRSNASPFPSLHTMCGVGRRVS